MRLSRIVRASSLTQAEELDPHKKVKDLIKVTQDLRKSLEAALDIHGLSIGDFYMKFPKAKEAKAALEPLRKKVEDCKLSAFKVLRKLESLDKQKE